MTDIKYTILESWPALKDDLIGFISDTDAWIITELRNAYQAKDWVKIGNIIDVMESVHNLSHPHEHS